MSDEDVETVQRTSSLRAPSQRPESLFMKGEIVAGMYEIGDVLGAGGMGQVFAAHDRILDRHVAIKGAWPGMQDAIRREARALAAIRHPSMITVYTVGLHRGVEFLVMERIFGINLFQKLVKQVEAGELVPIDEALNILIGLAEALSVIHRSALVHRDLKPSNVMIAPGERVVLMDFGIARAECEDGGEKNASGTLLYMAPEAIEGHTHRGMQFLTDIYGFGVIAFQLLTLHLPFEGDEQEVMLAHVQSAVPDVRDLRPEIDTKLSALLRALLSKDPEARPQAMDDVVKSMRAIARHLPPRKLQTKFSVLIVDDDAMLARTLARVVRDIDADAEVRIAPNAEDGLKMVRVKAPHVILLDLNMPQMNGMEMVMWLSGAHLFERSQTILMSATATSEDVDIAIRLGVSAFIGKDGEFLAAIETTIGAMRARWSHASSQF
jgi:serine/threonine-protein kinase